MKTHEQNILHNHNSSLSILRRDISYYYENRVSERVQKVNTTLNLILVSLKDYSRLSNRF